MPAVKLGSVLSLTASTMNRKGLVHCRTDITESNATSTNPAPAYPAIISIPDRPRPAAAPPSAAITVSKPMPESIAP